MKAMAWCSVCLFLSFLSPMLCLTKGRLDVHVHGPALHLSSDDVCPRLAAVITLWQQGQAVGRDSHFPASSRLCLLRLLLPRVHWPGPPLCLPEVPSLLVDTPLPLLFALLG